MSLVYVDWTSENENRFIGEVDRVAQIEVPSLIKDWC